MTPEDYAAQHEVEIEALMAQAAPTLLRMAAEHLAHQKQESFLIGLKTQSGASWLTRDMGDDLERNYRRGYHQGYSMAISHLSRTSDRTLWERLADYCDGPLQTWRMRDVSVAGTTAPPDPPAR